jgi:hypothetical protein
MLWTTQGPGRPTARSVAWCSTSIWSAPDGSGLLTMGATSIQTDPEGTRRIVWMIKRMIKQGRQLNEPGSGQAQDLPSGARPTRERLGIRGSRNTLVLVPCSRTAHWSPPTTTCCFEPPVGCAPAASQPGLDRQLYDAGSLHRGGCSSSPLGRSTRSWRSTEAHARSNLHLPRDATDGSPATQLCILGDGFSGTRSVPSCSWSGGR